MSDDNKTKLMIGGKVVAQWEAKTEENTCTPSIYTRNDYFINVEYNGEDVGTAQRIELEDLVKASGKIYQLSLKDEAMDNFYHNDERLIRPKGPLEINLFTVEKKSRLGILEVSLNTIDSNSFQTTEGYQIDEARFEGARLAFGRRQCSKR